MESAYQVCLAYELRKRGFEVEEEKPVPAIYDEVKLECGFGADMVVNGQAVVEWKPQSAIYTVHKPHVLSHLRLLKLRFGLLINCHEEKLVDGVSRIVNGNGDVSAEEYKRTGGDVRRRIRHRGRRVRVPCFPP